MNAQHRSSNRCGWIAGFAIVAWIGLICRTTAAPATRGADRFSASWTNNLLTLRHPSIPGGAVAVWYLEAFLKSGAHGRDWGQSVMPHRTRLVASDSRGRWLRFRTEVQPSVLVEHEVRAGMDEVEIRFVISNRTNAPVDLQWFQPACIRVAGFTGRNQQSFIHRSFIETERGWTPLGSLRRTTEALYRGGQVYPMPGIPDDEANPRPIAADRPISGLIGCVSADDRWILATASDSTHELFEGVYVCLHSDPHVGGLKPREVRRMKAKIYLVPNDPAKLLARYRRDFPQGR